MQKTITIPLNPTKKQQEMLYNIRWRHIDIYRIIQETLEKESKRIITEVIEGVYCG